VNAATPRGLVIAAPSSGGGKTTITLGLLRHLKRKGLRVASAKAGPDYIDPVFHAAASGRPCLNLDPWAMRQSTVQGLLARLARDADVVICEGVMGLFDGAGRRGLGSTADLAALLGWPVVLVIDIAKQAGSAAALLCGFAGHRPDIRVAGVILNRAAGERHAALALDAIAAAAPMVKRLGWLPRAEDLALPERHLGLVQAGEHPALDRFLATAADHVGGALDIEGLLDLAAPTTLAATSGPTAPLTPIGQRVAVASDVAFAFAYPAVLEGWRSAGATVFAFSPLADEPPPADADAVYLPGGYPELHAESLAAAGRFLGGLQQAAARGAVIYGECGGYMVLGHGLVAADGKRHAMAGLLPLETSFAKPRLHLGYRRANLLGRTALGAAGTGWRGHEFHYASIIEEGASAALFTLADAEGATIGRAGCVAGNVMGSFVHLIDRE
jgi:cobyrinic acid a,c-diamide synthase